MGPGSVQRSIIISIFLPVILLGCEVMDRFSPAITPQVIPYQTVSSILTGTASGNFARISPGSPSKMNSGSLTPGSIKGSSTPPPPGSQLPEKECNKASAGNPMDLTIPDNSVVSAGARFSKTWRLVNSGSCDWTRGYAVVWFSGDLLAPVREVFLNQTVVVGQSIDISIDMIAPETPGVYQSNWKLRSPAGELFGIGPGGASAFWVRINIIKSEEKTPTALPPTSTPTLVVYSASTTTIYLSNTLDLEKGAINPLEGFDLQFKVDPKNGILLVPSNGAKIGMFGRQEPKMPECQLAFLNPDPILMNNEKENVYYCYSTDQGLPGRFMFTKIDPSRGIFEINFLTWYLP